MRKLRFRERLGYSVKDIWLGFLWRLVVYGVFKERVILNNGILRFIINK